MLIRQPILDRSTVKALLALTKTRGKASDHALRPPVFPNIIYQLNQMLQQASDPETQRIRQIIETYRSDLLEDFDQFRAIAQLG